MKSKNKIKIFKKKGGLTKKYKKYASDMANSLIDKYKKGGLFDELFKDKIN